MSALQQVIEFTWGALSFGNFDATA